MAFEYELSGISLISIHAKVKQQINEYHHCIKLLTVVGNFQMNIFFTQRHKYTVNDTVDNVRTNIESITGRRWYDFSDNITGRLNGDGSFKLTHKWSFAVIKWIENSPAYLSGTLTEDGNKTIIGTTLRPNSGLVMFFYLLTILFLCELIGINTFIQGPKTFKLLFFPFFNLILFGLMKMFTIGLRNRFERLMQLQRDE